MTEEAAQAHPGGPIETASAWINGVLRGGSLALIWPITAEDLRRELAADWVSANQNRPPLAGEDLDAIVEDLASLEPTRLLLWLAFDACQGAYLRELWSHVDLDTWGWATDPRPVGVDREVVLLVDAGPLDDRNRPIEPGPCPSVAFTLCYSDGVWLVGASAAPEDMLELGFLDFPDRPTRARGGD